MLVIIVGLNSCAGRITIAKAKERLILKGIGIRLVEDVQLSLGSILELKLLGVFLHHFGGPLCCSYRIDFSYHTRSILSSGYALLKNTKVFEGTLSLFLELSLPFSSQQ